MIDPGDPDTDDRPGRQKSLLSFIKSPKKDSSGIAPLNDRGKMHADLVDKANILNHQYETVYTREDEGDFQCLDGQPYPSIVSEYDQEIPQSQTTDNPIAPRGRAAQPSRDTRKTN